MLQGDQGGLKSTFFKNLASAPWFCDTQLGSISKDLYIRVHSCWFYEIAELEVFTTKREAGAVKGLLSSSEDRFRPPYGRSSDVFKRSGIFLASVNLDGFLVDRTGNRRFMVIRLPRQQGHKIPVHLAERDRDTIWRAFVLAYDAGIKPILNEAEQRPMRRPIKPAWQKLHSRDHSGAGLPRPVLVRRSSLPTTASMNPVLGTWGTSPKPTSARRVSCSVLGDMTASRNGSMEPATGFGSRALPCHMTHVTRVARRKKKREECSEKNAFCTTCDM